MVLWCGSMEEEVWEGTLVGRKVIEVVARIVKGRRLSSYRDKKGQNE